MENMGSREFMEGEDEDYSPDPMDSIDTESDVIEGEYEEISDDPEESDDDLVYDEDEEAIEEYDESEVDLLDQYDEDGNPIEFTGDIETDDYTDEYESVDYDVIED